MKQLKEYVFTFFFFFFYGNIHKALPCCLVWFLAQYLYCFAERNEGENNLNWTLRQVTIQFFS